MQMQRYCCNKHKYLHIKNEEVKRICHYTFHLYNWQKIRNYHWLLMCLTQLMVPRTAYLVALNLAWKSKSALFSSNLTWIKGKQYQGEEKHLIPLQLCCSPTSHHLMMNEFHIISKGHLSQLKQCEKSLNRGWSVEDGGKGAGGVGGTKAASEVMISTSFQSTRRPVPCL